MKKTRDISWFAVWIAALIPASTQLIWLIYNSYVPLWLQAGNAAFKIPEGIVLYGFGYGAFVTGIILTVDNIAALFLSPLVGMVSDGTRSRFGRRKPWIIFGTPLAVVAFIVIPYLALRVPAELTGQTAALTPLFIPFFIALVLMLLPLAIVEVPSNTILFDITPSKYRSAVYAIAVTVGGIMNVVGAIFMGILFDINPVIPFIGGGVLLGVFVILAAFCKVFKNIAALPKENKKSLILLLVSVIFAFTAFGQMQSFLSSYNVTILGMSPATASMVYAAAGGAFILGTLPGGLLPKYIKRKMTSMIGLVGFALVCVLVYFFTSATLIWVYVGLGGFFWALVNINLDVMLYDSAPSDALLGTYGGLLVMVKTLGFILGPLVGGFIVQTFGNSYNNIWISIFFSLIVSMVVLQFVTKGEAKTEEKKTEIEPSVP
ncbi:MAG: MFS transporter [Chloroflexi bacterium]|nr:MFS transporter [Chloroflexota bacterium]